MPPLRHRRQQNEPKCPYETPICKILVGEDQATFRVNEGFLQSTTFYAKHGLPRRRDPERQPLPDVTDHPPGAQSDAHDLFFGENRSQTIDDVGGATIDLTDSDADYELKGKFYYSRDASLCLALFKAYALATYYDVEALQNNIIATLQKYYLSHMIAIADLMYVINHWGDNVDTNLAAYLVAQAGFEMAQDWVRYRAENDEIGEFFLSKNRVVIEEVFKAAVRHAKPEAKNDPAKDKQAWRVIMI